MPKTPANQERVFQQLMDGSKQAEAWQSELRFFKDELHFLEQLFNTYFLDMHAKEHIGEAQLAMNKLQDFKQKNEATSLEVNQQLQNLATQIRQSPNEVYYHADAHDQLAVDVKALELTFRTLKKEIYALAEQIMRSQKGKNILAK